MKHDLREAIAAYIAGDDSAAVILCEELRGPIAHSIQRFLPDSSGDRDDVIQETLQAVLTYLRKNGGFSGDLRKLAVTIGNNRCRDLLRWRKRHPQVPIEPLSNWIADQSRSPLEEIVRREHLDLLRVALDRLDRKCRSLLRAIYVEQVSSEEIRQRIGLTTVQGVYYRKTSCLKKALDLFLEALSRRSDRGTVLSANEAGQTGGTM